MKTIPSRVYIENQLPSNLGSHFPADTIGIIIPTLNRLSFVERCIDSIKKQTHHRFIVVVVDGGSVDGTAEYIAGLAKEDPRFIYLPQMRKGVSAARNEGLDYLLTQFATDWICFVDSDDFLEENYLFELLQSATPKCDIITSGYKTLYQLPQDQCSCCEKNDYLVPKETLEDFYLRFAKGEVFPTVWGKLFRSQLIGKLRFIENITKSEDQIYLCQAFSLSNSIIACNSTGYLYQTGEHGGLTNRRLSLPLALCDPTVQMEILSLWKRMDSSKLREAAQILINRLIGNWLGLFGRFPIWGIKNKILKDWAKVLHTFERDNKLVKKSHPILPSTKARRWLYLYCRPMFYLTYSVSWIHR